MVKGKYIYIYTYIYMILKYVSYRARVTDINSYLSLACNCAAKCLAWFAWSSLSRYAKLSETVSGFSTFLELCRRVRRRCALPSWNCALPESFGFEYLETFADSAKIPSKQQWRFQKSWPSDPCSVLVRLVTSQAEESYSCASDASDTIFLASQEHGLLSGARPWNSLAA